MSKFNRNLYVLGGLLILVSLVGAQSLGLLQGRFGVVTVEKMSCSGMPSSTIYVTSSAGITTDGTSTNPYRNLSSVQNRLETDRTIQGVCFSGTPKGTLDLNGVLTTSLVLKASSSGAVLGSSSSTSTLISYSGGDLDELVVSGLTFNDPVSLDGLSDLTLSSNTFSNESGTDLTVKNTETLVIEKSIFTGGASTGISLNKVGQATVANNFILNHTSKGINSVDTDLELFFNSFYNNHYAAYLDGVAKVKNNIFYSLADQYALYYEYYYSSSAPSGIQVDLTSDYNLYYTEDSDIAYVETTNVGNTVSEGYVSEFDLEQLQASGWDTHSKEGDPLFVEPSSNNLHISKDSAAKNAGQSMLSVSKDIDGENRTSMSSRGGTSSVDIGADEY